MNVYSQRLWILQEINLVRLALIVSGQSTFTTLSHPLAPLLPHDLPHLNHKRPLPILPRPLRPPPQNRPRNLTLKPRITRKPHHDILRRQNPTPHREIRQHAPVQHRQVRDVHGVPLRRATAEIRPVSVAQRAADLDRVLMRQAVEGAGVGAEGRRWSGW